MTEALARTAFDFSQSFFGRGNPFDDVLTLNRQEQQTLFRFGQLFERHHVHAAKTFKTSSQFFDSCVARIEDRNHRRNVSFAREIIQRLAQLGLAVLMNKGLSCLSLGSLHFQARRENRALQPPDD